MAKKTKSYRKTRTLSVTQTLMGIGMVNAATNGAIGNAVTGNFGAAGHNLQNSISAAGLKQNLPQALKFGAGMAGIAFAKKIVGVNPGVKLGQFRLTV